MKTLFFLFAGFLSVPVFAQVSALQNASDKAQQKIAPNAAQSAKKFVLPPSMLVNPLIGTGGHGHTFPGVSAPFGMMQLSPDTRYEGWDGCGGYHYSDSIIYGFSHTHLSGTGVPDYADLLFVPQSGEAKWNGKFQDPNGYGSSFRHDQEVARLGYYEVKLQDENIQVKLSALERSGIHEYTFLNENERKFILIDLNYRDKLLSGKFNIIDKQHISGYRISEAWANEQHFNFYLSSSIPFISSTLKEVNGELKLLLEFPMSTKDLTLTVGMSNVDEAGAKMNLQAEIPHFSIQQVYNENLKKWNHELGKIDVQTPDTELKSIFYTALYHAMVAPNLISDVDGRYRGRDQKIHQLSNLQDQQYTVFSIWDTYRANHPLFTLIDQKRSGAFIRTFLRQYDEGGDLPVWELAACETECMIGYHSVSVITDAYLKGIRDFDAEKALKAMVSTSTANEFGKLAYGKQGLISSADEPESVSRTLEYAYDDFCIAQFAKALGQDKLAKQYELRSKNFVNLYDPNTKFMRARRGAQWYGPFDPSEVNFNYTEANSWQYSLYAPQDIELLKKLLGGPDSLEMWLDRLFTTQMKLSGREQADITGLIGQYAHGNEPSHHMAYLYNFTNAPYKTQSYVDRILKEMYQNQPDGLAGNEDCGQMSAWYVWSALGLYPVTPGNPVYQIGRPLFQQASIQLENGKSVQVVCKNQDITHPYIQAVTWNGKPLDQLQINHETLLQGGILLFEMGATPNKKLHTAAWPTLSVPNDFIPVPFIETEQRVFSDSLLIVLGSAVIAKEYESNPAIFYQIDSEKWQLYKAPFYIHKNVDIQIKAGSNTSKNQDKTTWSAVVGTAFIKKDPNIKLSLQSKYSNQYTASGPDALIDGLRGGNEFRTGDYQGYYNQDVVAVVIFEQARGFQEVGFSYIKDHKSWIFAPSQLKVEGSLDGQNYATIALQDLPQATAQDKSPEKAELLISLNSKNLRSYKYLRFTLKNPGLLPSWHLGAGNPTWLFIDELIFR
ncbi:MAG: hypothetical protein RLZZ65_1049 [Bacteroidota bacterium]|jgi:predicted alpha-1,2-mannosidase